MRYLIDGSNALGRAGAPRESIEAKRQLVQAALSLSRVRRASVVVFFDGAKPDAFATGFGRVSVRFSAPRSADDLIVEEALRRSDPCTVITADSGIAARVRSRHVRIAAPHILRLDGERSEEGSDADWEAYFSDERNRNI